MEAEEGGRPLMRQQQRTDARQERPLAGLLHQGGGRGEAHNNVEASLQSQYDNEEEEPLLVKPMTCSYRALLNLLGTLDFGRKSSTLGFNNNNNNKPPPSRACGGVGEVVTTTTSISEGHPPPAKRQKKAAATEAQVIATPNVSNNKSSSSSTTHLLLLPHELCVRVLQFLTIQRVNPNQVVIVGCSSHDGAHDLSSCLDENEDTWWLSAPGSMPRGKGAEWIQFALAPTTSSSSPSPLSSSLLPSSSASSSSSNFVGGIKSRLCRLSSVSMKIPPLPQGPLSVLEFTVQRFCSKTKKWYNIVNDETDAMITNAENDHHDWGRHASSSSSIGRGIRQAAAAFSSPLFSLENRTGWQQFRFAQELDVDEVRIVCLRNQISPSVQRILGTSSSSSSSAATADIGPLGQQLSRFESVGFIAIRFD